jgi:hypothetical protein
MNRALSLWHSLSPRRRGVTLDRFFGKVDTRGKCWRWRHALDKDGYGKFQLNVPGSSKQVHVRAHQFSLFLATGEWKNLTQHRCHHEWCVRPTHIFWGTQRANVLDALQRGTFRSVLKEEQVREIKFFLQHGASALAVARRFKISRCTVYQIKNGKTWRWIK